MKVLTVIGARPQIIKAAAVSNKLRKKHKEVLVHTGQHYDENMSNVFFEQMNVPKPEINLHIGSGCHGEQTGRMMAELEKICINEKPDFVMVYGDTNSTLAGTLAASKLHIPVAHVEAGLRSFNKKMPEEQNRIVADHLSTLLFAPTKSAADNLAKENIISGVHIVGDVMFDVTLSFSKLINEQEMTKRLQISRPYLLATVHRAENTDDSARLGNIVEALNQASLPIVLPLHPRTKKYMEKFELSFSSNVHVIEPVGYLEMLFLEKHAEKILTDSGGVQKEAFFLDKPCITLRNETEWCDTVETGWNTLVGCDVNKILDAIDNFTPVGSAPRLYGSGDAADIIIETLVKTKY